MDFKSFSQPNLPEGYEFIDDKDYTVKKHDLYWYSHNEKLYRDTIHVIANKTIKELQAKYSIPYFAKFTGKMAPYFKDKESKPYPFGF